jgi:DNA-binding NarL/FixJ family response regulator
MEQRIRLLIADDAPRSRDGLRALLSTVRLSHLPNEKKDTRQRVWPEIKVVGEATDGEQAINLVETCRPDVVLMDARMPIIDGLEATRRIKKRWPAVKVIVLTVYAAYRSAAQAAGADAFVIKGAPPEELLEAILDPQEEEDDVQQSIPGATTGA